MVCFGSEGWSSFYSTLRSVSGRSFTCMRSPLSAWLPREGRAPEDDKWGRPRVAMDFAPPSRGCSWLSLEVGSSCMALTVTVRGRPGLSSAVRCSIMLITCCTFVLKSVWVLIDRLVTESGPNWTWCTTFGLNLCHLCRALDICFILCSGPSPRGCTMRLHRGRPAGLT